MLKTGPSRACNPRKKADGPVEFFHRRGQPFGWPALLLSLGIHGAVFATVAWLSFGGQGHSGTDGMEAADTESASTPVPVLRMTAPQEYRVSLHKVPTFAPANAPRLLSISSTATLRLPKWDMQPSTPLQAAAPVPAATPLHKPLPTAEAKRNGLDSRTQRKAAGQGAGTGMGTASAQGRTPQLVSSYPPPYPAKARREHIEGTTVVRVTVSDQGRVLNCSVHRSAGDEGLDIAALRAVRGWRFTPAVTKSADVLVRVTFRLS